MCDFQLAPGKVMYFRFLVGVDDLLVSLNIEVMI